MTIIKPSQKCQIFDPIMIYPEKSINICDDPMTVNTSCAAPASVYLEGTRGKRYLCDYHFYFEKSITCERTPNLWPEIAKIIIDERDSIIKTFPKIDKQQYTINQKCWCDSSAYVKVIPKKDPNNPLFFCNFHYRKTYYRYISNNRVFENEFDVVDERYKMSQTIIEEAEQLKVV